MLITVIFMFLLVLPPILLGYSFLSLLFPKAFESKSEKVGISFGLGLGLITIIQIIFLSLRIKITPFSLIPAILLLLIIFSLLAVKKRGSFFKKERKPLNWISKIILIFIIIQGSWVMVKAFNLPIITDDAVVIWGLKAKTIYYSNLFGDSIATMAGKMSRTLSGNYPILIPLAENYFNLLSSDWNDLLPKITSPLFYFSLLLAFFGLLRRFSDKNYALIFTFFLSSLPFLSDSASDAIADLPFAYYYAISFILIIIWMQNKNNHYLYLSAIFSAFAIWTKNEGYASLLINLIIILIFIILNFKSYGKELAKGLGGFLTIIIPVILLIAYYQHLTGIKEGIINKQTLSLTRLTQNLPRIPFILYQLQRQLSGTPNKWNLLGHLFLFILLINFKRAFSSFYFNLLLAIVLNFILYTTVYTLSPHEVTYHVGTSQNRVLMHFLPLALFFSAIILYQKDLQQKN